MGRVGRVGLLCLLAFLPAIPSLLGLPALYAQPSRKAPAPTFYRDVLPILQAHCQECHKPDAPNLVGLVAPMSLITYADAHANARAIARVVQAREMPPWFASPRTKGIFANERTLTEAQIATIVAWQKAGAAEGRATDAPPPRDFGTRDAAGWTLGEPNIAVAGEPHVLDDNATEDMITFQVGELPQDVWVQGIEFRAGSSAVHHMCGAAILPPHLPAPPGIDRETSLGCAAPGVEPRMLPEGYAYLLPKGAGIRLDMHYVKKAGPGTAVTDISQVGLTFARTPARFRVRFNPAGNTTFEVPPNHANWLVGAARTFEAPATLLALWPHGHSRTSNATYWAFYPDGKKELLLDVPKYDHRWQQLYVYRTPKQIPAGTRIEVTYRYDNSAAQGARKGFDSNDPVRFGARGNDEMMLGYVNYAEPITGSPGVTGSTGSSAHAGHNVDAADLDRLTRGTAKMPENEGVQIDYPTLPVTSSDFRSIDALTTGGVLKYAGSAAMRLRTEVPLRFGALTLPPGNVAPQYAGLYGMWLKKTAGGWRLVFTHQPDVWGTQFDAAAVVAETPVLYEKTARPSLVFAVRIEGDASPARLVMSWGPHQWTAGLRALFALQP